MARPLLQSDDLFKKNATQTELKEDSNWDCRVLFVEYINLTGEMMSRPSNTIWQPERYKSFCRLHRSLCSTWWRCNLIRVRINKNRGYRLRAKKAAKCADRAKSLKLFRLKMIWLIEQFKREMHNEMQNSLSGEEFSPKNSSFLPFYNLDFSRFLKFSK